MINIDGMEHFKSELKDEVIQLFEDDRRLRNIRFNEVYNVIEQNKSMQMELIVQQFESQKALMKAIVNKEAAERMLADEELMLNVNAQLKKYKIEPVEDAKEDKKDKNRLFVLEAKIDSSYNSLQMKYKNSQMENKAEIEELN